MWHTVSYLYTFVEASIPWLIIKLYIAVCLPFPHLKWLWWAIVKNIPLWKWKKHVRYIFILIERGVKTLCGRLQAAHVQIGEGNKWKCTLVSLLQCHIKIELCNWCWNGELVMRQYPFEISFNSKLCVLRRNLYKRLLMQ